MIEHPNTGAVPKGGSGNTRRVGGDTATTASANAHQVPRRMAKPVSWRRSSNAASRSPSASLSRARVAGAGIAFVAIQDPVGNLKLRAAHWTAKHARDDVAIVDTVECRDKVGRSMVGRATQVASMSSDEHLTGVRSGSELGRRGPLGSRQAQLVHVDVGGLGHARHDRSGDSIRDAACSARGSESGARVGVDGRPIAGVSTALGETSVVRTPVPRSSARSTSCSARNPYLLAAYAPFSGNTLRSATEPMVTMCPVPRSRIDERKP